MSNVWKPDAEWDRHTDELIEHARERDRIKDAEDRPERARPSARPRSEPRKREAEAELPSSRAELLAKALDVLIRESSGEELVHLTALLVGRLWEARHRLSGMEAKPGSKDLTSAEAAKLLCVTTWTIGKLAREGKLPGHYRVGRVIRVPSVDIERLRHPGASGPRPATASATVGAGGGE